MYAYFHRLSLDSKVKIEVKVVCHNLVLIKDGSKRCQRVTIFPKISIFFVIDNFIHLLNCYINL